MKPCLNEATIRVRVKVPADLNWNGQEQWKNVPIDQSIAGIVWALQTGGVDMRGSCSGHGRFPGNIALADGRVLLIVDERYYTRPIRVLVKAIGQHLRHELAWRLRRLRDWFYRPGRARPAKEALP